MTKPFSIVIAGRPDDGFTSAEVYADAEEQDLCCRVFELESGWYVELNAPEALRDASLVEAIIEAKATLLHYVNRKGGVFPEDATPAGISLWLMQRDDGEGFTVG